MTRSCNPLSGDRRALAFSLPGWLPDFTGLRVLFMALLFLPAMANASHFEGAKWTEASVSSSGQFNGTLIQVNSGSFRANSKTFEVLDSSGSHVMSSSFPNLSIDNSDPAFEIMRVQPQFDLSVLPHGLYRIRMQNCCRISNIQNAPGDGSYAVEVSVAWNGENVSAPVYFGPAIVRLTKGDDFHFPTSAFLQTPEPVFFELMTNQNAPEYAADPIPGMNFNTLTGAFSMTAADTMSLVENGAYVAKFSVVTESGMTSDWDIMFRSITVANNPPVLDPIPGGLTATIGVGDSYSVPLRAVDPDSGDIVTLRGQDLPANASVPVQSGNPAQSTLTFTPVAAQAGTTYPLVVEAKDNHPSTPLTDTVTIHVTVVEDASALPVIDVRGGGNSISAGDDQPSSSTGTSFGTVLIGETVSRTFEIHNTGNNNLDLVGMPQVALSGAQVADFQVTSQPNSPVSPGSSTQFTVEFMPQASGSRQTTVRVDSNDPSQPYFQFAIGGTGTASPVPAMEVTGNGILIPDGDISPRSADNTDFGSVDYISGATLTNTFTVVNSGSAQLDLTGSPAVVIGGPAASEFLVVEQPSSTIGANDSSTFQIEFNPSASGERRATLSIPSNDIGVDPYTFDIRGFGVQGPNMRVLGNGVLIPDGSTSISSSDNTSFGSVGQGSSANLTYVIENVGSAELNLTGSPVVALGGAHAADFTVTTDPVTPVGDLGGATSFEVTFTPSALGNRNATISIPSDDPNADPYNFDVRGQGVEVPELSLSKQRTDGLTDPLHAGDSIEFTVTATNLSSSITVSDVVVSDSMITPSTITCASVPAGESCELVGSYTLTQADIDAGEVMNTASASSPDVEESVEVVLVTPLVQVGQLTLSKVLFNTNPSPAQVGSELSFSIVASNSGNITLNNVVVTDPLTSPSIITCPTVAPTASCVLFGFYTLTQEDVDAGGFVNIASASANNASAPPDASWTVPIDQNPALDFDMVYNGVLAGPEPLALGSELSYTISITNTGDVTLTDVLIGTDPGMVPFVEECASVAPGSSCVLEAIYTITQADVDAGGVTNVAMAGTSTVGLADPADASISHSISQSPSLDLAKTLSAAPGAIELGSMLDYTVTATNTGNVTLSSVIVSDGLLSPASITCTDLSPGAECVLEGSYQVTQADVDAGQVHNTATATTPDADDPSPASVVTAVDQTFELTLDKTFDGADSDPAPVALGSVLAFTVTATNSGTVTLDSVVVSDPLLDNSQESCTDLGPGDSCVLSGSYEVVQADVDAGVFSNTATATSDQAVDPQPATVNVTIEQNPAMSVTKVLDGSSTDPFPVVLDSELTYTITLANTGDVTLTGAVITDLQIAPSTENCGSIDVGQSCVLTGSYTVQESDVAAGEVVNTAQAVAAEIAAPMDSNTVVTPVDELPALGLSFAPGLFNPALEEAGWSHFTASLTNTGGDIPENVVLWAEVQGIDNGNKIDENLRLEYFDGMDWIELGWGGFASGDFPDISRQAWFLGRDGNTVPGFELPAGYDAEIPMRVNWSNGTWQVFSSIESLDSADGGDAPGERVYLVQADSFVVETTPVELTLDVGYGTGDTGAAEASGWAEFHATLANHGGDVPENTVLWIEVDGLADADWLDGAGIQHWTGSEWRDLGWAGASSVNYSQFDRDAWFLGRDGDGGMVGFPIPADHESTIALRVNFPNASYSVRTTVESLYPADGVTEQGERVYLDQTSNLAIAADDVDLALVIVENIPSLPDSSLDQDWAYFQIGLDNDAAAGDLPEPGVLYIAAEDADPAAGDDLQFWDGSQWVSFGYDPDLASWYFQPDGSGGTLGFDLDAGDLILLDVRLNFGNGSYELESTITGELSGEVYGFFTDTLDVVLVTPILVLSPSQHDFEEVLVGSAESFTFTLNNAGESFTELALDTFEVTGDSFALLAGTCAAGQVLTPADSCTVAVEFAPPAPVGYTGLVTVSSDYNTAISDVAGTGVQPELSVIPPSLNFGDTQVGETSGTLGTMLVNTGTAPLTLSGVGSVAGLPFTRTGGDCTVPLTLAPGEYCTLEYVFEPTATGIVSEGVGINSDAPTTPDAVSLVGTGVNRSLTLDPSSIDFGEVIVDEISATASVELINNGTTLLAVDNLSLVGDHATDFLFIGNSCGGVFLPEGASCTFSVAFNPQTTGVRNAVVEIYSDASTSPDVFPLVGAGIQAVAEMSPAGFDFGPSLVLEVFATEFLVSNTGDVGAPLAVESLDLDGDDVFEITGGSCEAGTTILDGGQSCTVLVTFAPEDGLSYAATLDLATSEGPKASDLLGQGYIPDLVFEIADGVDTSVDDSQSGWTYHTAILSNLGDAVPENVALWVEIDGIDDDAWVAGAALELWNPVSEEWTSFGWGGVSGNRPVIDRDAFFLGRPEGESGGPIEGFGIGEAGSPDGEFVLSVRVNLDNGTFDITTTVESVDWDQSQAFPGVDQVRVYGLFEEQVVIESVPVALSFDLVEEIPAIDDADLDEAWAYFSATLANAAGAGDTPEPVLLYVAVGNTDQAAGDDLQYWGGDSWISFGWDEDRQAWYLGRDGTGGLSGFDLPAGSSVETPIRVNFADGLYNAQVDVEGLTTSSVYGQFQETILVSQIHAGGAIDPVDRDFGEVLVGELVEHTFVVLNDGESFTTLGLEAVGVVGGDAFEIIDGSCATGHELAGGESCEIVVAFAPGQTGGFVADLELETTAGSLSAALTGTGLAAAELVISPLEHDFGDVLVDSTQSQEFTLGNMGDPSSALEITDVGISGGGFGIGGGSCVAGTVLTGGDDCTVEVTFSPDERAEFAGQLAVATDQMQVLAQLEGVGIAPVAGLAPNSIDFGPVQVGEAAGAQALVLSNMGDAGTSLSIDDMTVSGEGFELVSDDCPAALAAGEDCAVQVDFVPLSGGPSTGMLSIGTGDGIVTAALEGVAIDAIDLALSGSASPDPVPAGGMVTYNLVAANLNTTGTASGVVLDVELPAGATLVDSSGCAEGSTGGVPVCTIGTLNAGEDAAIVFQVEAPEDMGNDLVFAAVVSSDQDDPDASNNSIELVTGVALDGLTILKEFVANADEDGTGTITVGNTLSYRVTATNAGTTVLSNVLVIDSLIEPDSQLCESLASKAECVLEGTYTVTADDTATGQIVNVASAEADGLDPVSDSVTVQVSQADMVIVKELIDNADEDGTGVPSLGNTLTYRITVTNTGAKLLTNVEITDALLDTSETVCAQLQTGETCVLEGSYVIDEDDVDSGLIINVANANADEVAPVSAELRTRVDKAIFSDRFEEESTQSR